MTSATASAGPGLGTYVVLLVLVLAVGIALAVALRHVQRSPWEPPQVLDLGRPDPVRAAAEAGRPAGVVLVVSTLSYLVPRPPPAPPVLEDEVIAFGLDLEATDDVVGDVIRESGSA